MRFFCDFLDSRNNILKGKMYANTSTKKREKKNKKKKEKKRERKETNGSIK